METYVPPDDLSDDEPASKGKKSPTKKKAPKKVRTFYDTVSSIFSTFFILT